MIIGSRGQTVIPLKIREKLGMKPGDAFAVDEITGKLVAERINTPSREELLMRWNKTTKKWNKQALKLGIREEDVEGIIHRGRGLKD